MTMDRTKIYTILLSLVSLALTACSDDAPFDGAQELVPMSIDATPGATRTMLGDDHTTVLWEASDQIAVYDFKASKHSFTTNSEGSDYARFSGQVTAKTEPFAAVYPYALATDNAASAAALSASLPATQYVVANNLPLCQVDDQMLSCNVSVGKGARNIDGNPSAVTFHNVCQMLRFSVPEYASGKISRIQFTATKAVVGTLAIDYSGDAPVASVSGASSITVLPPVGSTTFAAGIYNIVCAPVQLSGFSLALETSGRTYTLASASTFGGQAGHVYMLGSIDLVDTPQASVHHVYDNGILQGTSLTLSGAPVEGKAWSAVVKNAGGATVRTLSGTGDLASDESDASWPYLPAGSYTVEYTFTSSNERSFTRTLSLTVPAPALTLSVSAYTAHSKYEEGNVDAANQCDRLTVYQPSAVLSVSPSLMANSRYTRTFTRTLNGQAATTTESTNTPSWANYTNIPVQGSLHTLSVTANFAGTQVTATKQVRITGLPANFTPPTQATGWSNDNGTTDFNGDHVRLGNYSFSQPHRIKNSTWFNIPQGTLVALDYDIVLHSAAVNTTANVKMGSQQVVYCNDSKYGNDVHNTGIEQFTLNENVTSVTCEGSYGSGATHTKVYKLYFKYGKTN